MNVDNGNLYYTRQGIEAARARGENIVEFEAAVAEAEAKAERHKRFLEEFGEPVEYSPAEYARTIKRGATP